MSGDEPAGAPQPPPAWDPSGTELARALLGRALARGRPAGSGEGAAGGSAGRAGGGSAAASRGRRGGAAGGSGGSWVRRGASRDAAERAWSGPGGDERDPQGLGPALDRLVAERGWGADLAGHGAIARWDLVVGPGVAAHVTPECFVDGELVVRADSSAWAMQMRLFAPTVLARFAAELGDAVVTRLRVLAPAAPSWRRGPRTVRGRGPRDTYG